MRLRDLCGGLLLLASASLPACAQKAWLFAYFKEPANQGIYLAISHDGYHFTALNDGQPWVKPQEPGEIMRDVFLTRGPDNKFHMVWTWGWHGKSLGYADSPDLLHWSAQKEIPIMEDYPEARNVWAPETYWDAKKHKWLLIWSSSMNHSDAGNRIYSSLTADFQTFSKPSIFFDPGYVVIDATIFHASKKYYLVFKDQTPDPLRYQVRYATGPTLEGPWTHIAAPLTESWSEGPSVIHVGKEFIVYYDHYRAPARYEGVESTDWRHWESIDGKMSLPEHCKHGSFLEITPQEAARLEARHDAAVSEAQ
jgi:hypothetical protein